MPSFLEIGRKPVLLPRSFWAPRGQRRGATSWTPPNKETPPEHPKPWGSRPYPQSGRPDSDRRPPEPHYTQVIRQIAGDARFYSRFGENFLESESAFPGIQGGYVMEKVLEWGFSADPIP